MQFRPLRNPLLYMYSKMGFSCVHIYSCPMKTQHPSDAPSCGLSKVVQKSVMCIHILGQMPGFHTEISIRATA